MRHLASLSLLLTIFTASLAAQDSDPIREHVNKAVRDHEAIVANAKYIVTNEFDARIKATAATGNLDAVQKLVAEKKAHDATGAIPAWLAAVPAVKGYPQALAEASARLDAAYKSAEIAYTKALKLDEAEAVRAERLRANLVPQAPPPAAAKPGAPATPQAGGAERNFPMGAVDLMPFIDVEKDALSGRWSRAQGGLVSDRGWESKIRIRYAPPEEYDFLVEFTRVEGNESIGQLCWGYGSRFRWCLGGWGNTIAGIDEVERRQAGNNATSVKLKLENGRRYKSVVKVRKNQISCYLDDRLITSLETDYSDLSYHNARGLDDGLIGISTSGSIYIIHKLSVAEITGRGKRPTFAPSTNSLENGRRIGFPKSGF